MIFTCKYHHTILPTKKRPHLPAEQYLFCNVFPKTGGVSRGKITQKISANADSVYEFILISQTFSHYQTGDILFETR